MSVATLASSLSRAAIGKMEKRFQTISSFFFLWNLSFRWDFVFCTGVLLLIPKVIKLIALFPDDCKEILRVVITTDCPMRVDSFLSFDFSELGYSKLYVILWF